MLSLKDLDVGSTVPYIDHKMRIMERSGPVDNPMLKVICIEGCCDRPITIHMPELDLIELLNVILDKYGTIKMRQDIARVMKVAREKQGNPHHNPVSLSDEILSPFNRQKYFDAEFGNSKVMED